MASTTSSEGLKVFVVPNGISNGSLNFSIVLAPELSGGATGTLADFPDFGNNWPKTLSNGRTGFRVTFLNTDPAAVAPTQTVSVLIDTSGFRQDLWTALFPSSQPYIPRTAESVSSGIRGHVASTPIDQIPVVSYPVQQIHDFIMGQYKQLPLDRLPTYGEAKGVFSAIAPGLVGVAAQDTEARLLAERTTPGSNRSPLFANDFTNATPAEAFSALSTYFKIGGLPPPTGGPILAPGDPFSPDPELDFHSALTFVGEHRTLQRALGLVFDFSIALTALKGVPATVGGYPWYVSAALSSAISPAEPSQPNAAVLFAPAQPAPPGLHVQFLPVPLPTQLNLSTTTFEPFSNITDQGSLPIENGYLVINPSSTGTGTGSLPPGTTVGGPITINPGGEGGKTNSHMLKLQTWAEPPAIDGTTGTVIVNNNDQGGFEPPAITSSAIALTLVARAAQVNLAMQRGVNLFNYYVPGQYTGGFAYPLNAADLTRGLVLDVLDLTFDPKSTAWCSLNLRNSVYTPGPKASFATLQSPTAEEAGTQTPPTLIAYGTDPTQPNYLISEVILRFDGWSNAVPLPGTPLVDGETGSFGSSPFDDLIKITSNVVEGSLPLLRFGRTYQLRVRVVDIAGNVIPLEEASDGDSFTTQPLLYGRQDTIPYPDIYAQANVGVTSLVRSNGYPLPGEGLTRLVLRDIDVAEGLNNLYRYRVMAPPRCSPSFAERHGMFDTNGTLDISHKWYDVLVAMTDQYYIPPNAPAPTPLAQISTQESVPYLPDPLARGGLFGQVVVPASSTSQAAVIPKVSFDFSPAPGDAWPYYRPVGLQLVAAAAGAARTATFDSTQRIVSYALHPADVVQLSLCSTCNAADVEAAPAGFGLGCHLPSISGENAAAGGYPWALTPMENIELVYAVQKPTVAPAFTGPIYSGNISPINVNRQVGETSARLDGAMSYSPNSTHRIDVLASWVDPVDDPSSGPPNLNPPRVSNLPVFSAPPPFDPTAEAPPGSPAPANPAVTGFESFGTEISAIVDEYDNGRHEFHDTKYRLVTYSAMATSRFSEYYDPSTPASTFQLTGPGTPTPIPASARPASLSIAYVVPIYEWSGPAENKAGQIVSHRQASGLRVFIQRPWFSSGAGEQLAVVLWGGSESSANVAEARRAQAQKATAQTDAETADVEHQPEHRDHVTRRGHVRPKHKTDKHKSSANIGSHVTVGVIPSPDNLYVSDWGLDPVFAGGALPTPHPQIESFPLRKMPPQPDQYEGLEIEEDPSVFVNVAPHNVAYDPVRDLWYADIDVSINMAYTPMIRLALARYQANALSEVHLGRITRADVIALDPERTVTVTQSKFQGTTTVQVTVVGPSYSTAAGRTGVPGQSQTDTAIDGVSLAPPFGQVLLQRQNKSISSDNTLNWEGPVSTDPQNPNPAPLNPTGILSSPQNWQTGPIKVPNDGGTYRLYITLYEILPTDVPGDMTGKTIVPGYRVAFQDIIPLNFT